MNYSIHFDPQTLSLSDTGAILGSRGPEQLEFEKCGNSQLSGQFKFTYHLICLSKTF
jgi:hypothetical protein